MAYAVAAATGSDGPHQALHLQGALRGYNQAIQMLHIKSLRNEAERYGNQLIEYYLVYGQPRDPLDADRDVPTVHELNTAHTYLSDKLRRYEKT